MPQMPRQRAPDPRPDEAEVAFAANDIRLSPREWLVAAAVIVAAGLLTPIVWERIEPLEPGVDYRMPFPLGNDYWTYARYCRRMAGEDRTFVVGDSVVWGHYVAKDQTLSHYLGESAGGPTAPRRDRGPSGRRFANLGVDGIHPAALAGLVDHYSRSITGRDVILHCNLLWTSSPRHDLRTEKEFAFNHPRLVAQFSPWIPCYKAPLSERIGIVVGRYVPFLSWADHLRVAYYGNLTMPAWTMEHPCENPLAPVTLELASPDARPEPPPDARPWRDKFIRPPWLLAGRYAFYGWWGPRYLKFSPPWVDLEGAELSPEEVLSWEGLCRKLRDRGRDGRPGPAARIWTFLGPDTQKIIRDTRQWDSTGDDAASRQVEERKAAVVAALNAVLNRPDFYRKEDFESLDLPDEAEALLKFGRDALPEGKVRQLNRVLLEAAFGKEIAPRKPSIQWRAFQHAVGTLLGRGNRVFVVVGPFNEHMLEAPSLATYEQRKREVGFWLGQERKVPHVIPPALPSELYADASHPLAKGYQRMAREIVGSPAFKSFARPTDDRGDKKGSKR